MSGGGTVVYVHGASDREPGVRDHVEHIRRGLASRAPGFEVVSADWGDVAGPRIDDVLTAVPPYPPPGPPTPATHLRGTSRLLQAAGAGIVALQFLGVRAPSRLRVWATDVLLHRRAGLMQEILGIADVLVYQRDGAAIRDVVEAQLAAVPDTARPLIALGNSLGGVILVDLLREPGSPRPDLLVTVGSQAPVLQTFGGLGTGQAPPFEPWLNIYDARDFFAFIAQPVWPDQAGIRDERVDLGVGFPEVHGPAYLSHPAVWDAILAHPALG
jgi:hypothetical protein